MKLPLLPLLLLYCFSAIAQPTLTKATNGPSVGHRYAEQSAHTTGVTVGAPGANVTWDYSNLQDSTAYDTVHFITPSSTPYANLFPQANLATAAIVKTSSHGVTHSGAIYDYYLINDSGLYTQGVVTFGLDDTVVYTPALLRYPLPITYQNEFDESSQLVSKRSAERADTSVEKDTIIADGWGTLKLPGKTYSNVLRVVTHTVVANVYTTAAGIMFSSSFRSLTYTYLTPGYYAPLLQLVVDTVGNILNVTYSQPATLPLQFLSFNASLQKAGVLLNWTTAQEVNTHVFQIQRSSTGTNFTSIGQVAAQGRTDAHTYQFTDNSLPVAGVPVLYYRLAEVDLDGNIYYSKIQPVAITATKPLALWPNPVTSQLLHIQGTGLRQLTVFDAAGHLLQSLSLKGADSYNLNTQWLAKGVYLVTVRDGIGNLTTNKIVVQ